MSPAPPLQLLFGSGLGGFHLGQVVVDVLLDGVGVGAERRRPLTKIVGVLRTSRSLPLAKLASTSAAAWGPVRQALKVSALRPAASGELQHLVPGGGGGDEFLVVVDEVVHLPEGFGVLLVGAAASEGGGAGPGVDGVEGKVLEDDLDLGIFGQEAAQGVVETAANGAFEVRKLDDSDGSFGVTEDGSVGGLDLGAHFRRGGRC